MPSPLAEAFADRALAAPAATLAWTPAGVFTRADLAAAAQDLSPSLAAVAGRRIAVSVRDGCSFLAAVLAVWQCDGCVLLLDAADPQAPRRDLARQFGASALLTDGPQGVRCERLGDLPGGGVLAAPFAAIKLTSGSTAAPRGIAVTAAALLADARQLEATMGIGAGDRVFAAVPMSFSYGVGNLLVPALAAGRELVLPDADNPLGFLQALRAGSPTVLPAVPALIRALVQRAGALPPSLRLVMSAGAPLPPEVARQFRQRFGLPVHAFYGSTESGGISYDRIGDACERGSVGTAVDGVGIALEDGRVVVQSAAVGEALDGGEPRGQRFLLPDLGRIDAGELFLVGRAGEVFEVGGHKVNPREIERIVASLGGVDEVVVVPWRDRDGRASCAALVAGRGLDELTIRRHCALHLPAAKVPRCIAIVRELPRSDRGKLPRAEVERLLQAHAAAGELP